MRNPDPLIMTADIARVAAERPHLGRELVQALYQHLVLIEGSQPSLDELREYVERLSSHDEHALRQRLGLVARRKRGPGSPAAPEHRRPNEPVTAVIEPQRAERRRPTRGPGRPGWTDEL